MARAYRKKPVTVEAIQWTGENHAEMCEFIDPEMFEIIPRVGLVIHTLEGNHHASPGDYIIKGVNGEFYPCKPDIFAKTYETPTLTPPNEPRMINADKLAKRIAGHSNYHGDSILAAIYCAAEGKENDAPIRPIETTPNEWVSVEDRLPEKGQTVLFHQKDGFICCAEYFAGNALMSPGWFIDNDSWDAKEVTHWMPLPAPPKKENSHE